MLLYQVIYYAIISTDIYNVWYRGSKSGNTISLQATKNLCTYREGQAHP